MPSPIAHTVVGYLVYRATRGQLPSQQRWRIGPLPLLLGVAVLFAMLPDVDAIIGILAGDIGQFHNNGTHSLVFGTASAVFVATVIWLKVRSGFLYWFSVSFISVVSHILMDYFTVGGRGVMLLWPFTIKRFDSSIKLFYGVRWSDGLFSIEHLWTVLTEIGFVLLIILVYRVASYGTRRINLLDRQFEK